MFKFLNDCLVQTLNEEDLKEAHRKFDGSTILHAAIAAEHFGGNLFSSTCHFYLICLFQ